MMSRLPKVEDKPKNNKSTKFRWVDMQWERLMNRRDEDTKIIKQLQDDLVTCNRYFQKQREDILHLEMENAELKDMVLDLGGDYTKDEETRQLSFDFEIEKTSDNDFEVKKIYESPDGGKTIYQRNAGSDEREQIVPPTNEA
jgi:hypothetical protein